MSIDDYHRFKGPSRGAVGKAVLVGGIVVAVLAAILMALLATTAAPGPDMRALHYKAGPLTSTRFAECVDPGTRSWDGPADRHYYYPLSQRFWDATGGEGADAGRIVSVSDDNAEMYVPVLISFTLKGDCATLREFHEKIANRQSAYFASADDTTSEGWQVLLSRVMGKPAETVVDRVAQQYPWRDMWNKPEIRQEMEQEINAALPELVARQTGGEQYFENFVATVQTPTPVDEALLVNVRQEQNQVAAANAVKAKAEADKASAEAQQELAQAQVATAEAEAEKVAARIAVLGVDGYLRELAIEKGVNPFPTTVGTPVTSNR